MRQLINIMLLVATLVAGTCAAEAQHRRSKGERISREEFTMKQARHIAAELNLSAETTETFVATYMQNQWEVWQLGPRRSASGDSLLTDEQADSALQMRFDHSQKLLDIRRKYYAEYSKFLTPKQIKRFYELERKMMKQLSQQRAAKRNGRRQPTTR